MQRPPQEEFLSKETNADVHGWQFSRDKLMNTHGLVEQTHSLYVRVVKSINLPQKHVTGNCDPYVEVKLGNYNHTTHHVEKNSNPKWNQVFSFSKDQIQGSILEVVVKDKSVVNDDFIGRVVFDLDEIPNMVAQDGPLALQWYRLEDKRNRKTKGELLLAVWMGAETEADELSHLDAAESNFGSSVYLSPKLWYLRVNVIEAKNLQLSDQSRYPEVFVKATLGNQALKTKSLMIRNINPMWNEELMFVAAEPFEEPLILSLEDCIGPDKDKILGRCVIRLLSVERRADARPVNTRWYHVEEHVMGEGEEKKEAKFASTIHMRICLDGGYHVVDESTYHSGDLRPTAKQLWKPSIGLLELGILNARGLSPVETKDGRETTDAYCVAKYGQKWVRTKTIVDSFDPVWNEQYTWEVFDPCTIVTIGIFDNCRLQGGDKSGRDSSLGKVRIRLSTLETNRVYTHCYPLLVLHPSGVKKMGEIHLAIRFTCSSLINMMHMYSKPLLPKMHSIRPLTVIQVDTLRHHATQIIAMRLNRAEPPLRKEVVEYILDTGSHMWSMRKGKANVLRIVGLLSGFISFRNWFDEICNWNNPITTVLIHILFLILVMYRQLIFPSIFLCLFLIIVWYYRRRPTYPLLVDTRLSCADDVHPEELDEEFDTFPTSRPIDIVRMRYDRLRRIAGKLQTMVGDWATQGERVLSLVRWRDRRATVIFAVCCLVAAIILYITPFEVVAVLTGFYVLRHPRLRRKVPSVPSNFFRRLPARTDCIL
ncbi:hypothetical protein CDL12_01457 [Handroanthus impetiginosus]|uniref:C2 domain-containing protein n=1 Tax=Handroanthus impetiginosus TaxID=429701 RepID=A0A2G9I7T5_9LAMI|nr:hypothetical protein CDL12_01457 [Handroanthus impetiginosus]